MDINADIAIAVVIVAITLLVLILRTNVAMAIMGLCAGYVLSDLLSDELVSFVNDSGINNNNLPIAAFVSITLSLLPSLLILWKFKGVQKGRYIQQILPAVAFAFLAVLLVFTNLPFGSEQQLEDESYIFNTFRRYEILIAATVIGVAVFDVVVHEAERKRKYTRKKKRFSFGRSED